MLEFNYAGLAVVWKIWGYLVCAIFSNDMSPPSRAASCQLPEMGDANQAVQSTCAILNFDTLSPV
jgi:hypothetical protein